MTAQPATPPAAPAAPPPAFLWQRNLGHAFATHDAVVLYGNVRDQFLVADPLYPRECDLRHLLVRLWSHRYGPLLVFDPYEKATELTLTPADEVVARPDPSFGQPGFDDTLPAAVARLLAALRGPDGPRWVLFRHAHNVLPYRSAAARDERMEAVALQHLVEAVRPGKKVVFEYLTDALVPQELATGSPRTALVRVPVPGEDERAAFFAHRVPGFAGRGQLARLTDGLPLSALQSLTRQVGERTGPPAAVAGLTLPDWERAVRAFKFGESRDPYAQIPFDRLDRAREFFTDEEGVKGQDHAVGRVVEMLWKARTNVGSLLRDGANPPRGVLLFCGPSGTGKTMLGKKLAKFLFGSEDAFCRLDMSEFQQDHTVSKLIGSPPGYVGYEEGGVLTNAVAQKPFSVVLFDEIEKAHPRVFDLFLQILSDGRLTDSRGKTVFFSEAVVILTSNLGTRAAERDGLARAVATGDPGQVRRYFVEAVRNYFRYEVSRPELLNRFGNGIVPFNYMTGADVQGLAVGFYLDKLAGRFNDAYRDRGLSVRLDRAAVTEYVVRVHADTLAEFGGRGIVNVLDDVLLTPLAHRVLVLQEHPARGPVTLRVAVDDSGPEPRLVVR